MAKFVHQFDRLPIEVKGIYFLVDEKDEVLYVGRSKNIPNRIYQHKDKDFFGVYYLPMPDASTLELSAKEIEYIRLLNPPYNATNHSNNANLYRRPHSYKDLCVFARELRKRRRLRIALSGREKYFKKEREILNGQDD